MKNITQKRFIMSNNIYLKKGLDIPLEGAAALNTRQVIAPDIIAV